MHTVSVKLYLTLFNEIANKHLNIKCTVNTCVFI